ASSSFRSSKWDPILIIAQIAALQSLCYLVYSIILFIALTLEGSSVSLDLIFNYKEIRTDTGFGWSLIIVWLVNACLSIPILTFIVQRARQILDYVLTFHFFHLLFVWYISQQFPKGISWWLLQLFNTAIMTFGGEWACMHREMKPIMISGGSQKVASNKQQSQQQQ
ncbi:protein SYS1, partial [Parasitella parasitica]